MCSTAVLEECKERAATIEKLQLDRQKALQEKNERELQRINLKLSHNIEILTLYADKVPANDPRVIAINETYKNLEALLERQSGTQNPITAYTPEETLAVKEVFSDFGGELYIKPSQRDAQNRPMFTALKVSGDLPWTSYWYPKRDKVLFDGASSPLAKFDQVLAAAGKQPGAAQLEAESYSPDAAEWEGLCDAWAMASITTKEPKAPLNFKGVDFSISDLKALTVKLFEGNKPKIYGRRYLGTSSTDGQIQDLRPDAFHKLVMTVLGKQNRPLSLDTDPGPEVWAEPMFEMSWTVTEDPQNKDAYLVSAWPRFITYRETSDDTLTTLSNARLRKYEYRLYVDKSNTNADGEYKVLYGEWINVSEASHPDIVFVPSRDLTPSNRVLSENLDILKELLTAANVLPVQ
jgi:hypothetical protein